MKNILFIFSYTLFLIILGIFDFQSLQQAHRILGKKKILIEFESYFSFN